MKLLFTVIAAFGFLCLSAQPRNEHYKKAGEFFEKKEFQNALSEIELALKAEPANADFLLLKAYTLDNLQELRAAFAIYTRVIQLYPDNVAALNNRALLLNRAQQFEDALLDFNQALAINSPDSIRLNLFVNRSAVRINIRDFQGAYNDLMEGYKIDSLNIGVLNNIATVCDYVGKGDKTLSYLYKIISIDSNDIGAYSNIGFKHQEMEDHVTAIRYFDKVLTLDPEQPLAFNNRAYSRYKMGDLPGALKDVNRSIDLYPTNSYAFRNRAMIYLAMNDTENACADILKALDLGYTRMYGDDVKILQVKNCK